MRLHIRKRRWPILALGTLPLVLAGPAIAANVNITVGPSPKPNYGYGHVYGTMTYTGQKDYDYNMHVEDMCPADGMGVAFTYQMQYKDSSEYASGVKGKDTTGCGDGVLTFPGHISRPKIIKRARVIIWWTDDGELWGSPLDGVGGWHNNPNA